MGVCEWVRVCVCVCREENTREKGRAKGENFDLCARSFSGVGGKGEAMNFYALLRFSLAAFVDDDVDVRWSTVLPFWLVVAAFDRANAGLPDVSLKIFGYAVCRGRLCPQIFV